MFAITVNQKLISCPSDPAFKKINIKTSHSNLKCFLQSMTAQFTLRSVHKTTKKIASKDKQTKNITHFIFTKEYLHNLYSD